MISWHANKYRSWIYESLPVACFSQYHYQSVCSMKSEQLCCRKHQAVSSKLASPMLLPLVALKKGEAVYPIPFPPCTNGLLEITVSFFHGQVDPTLILFLGELAPTCCLMVALFKIREEKSTGNSRLVESSRMTGTLKIKPHQTKRSL